MASQIPEAFLEVTKCFTTDILEDGKNVIGLCTTSGQLLELVDKKVTDSCDIDRVADYITNFTSYDPLQKYYLIRCQNCLIVTKRSRPLCVSRTYEDVVEVKVQDQLRLGRPQVVIKSQSDKESIITDFSSNLISSSPHSLPLLTTSLSGKLQEMNARVNKARQLLQEKQNLRYKALYQFTPHLQAPVLEGDCEPKVLVWGPPITAQRCKTQPPLVLSPPWRKVNNGKWIIGVPVFNSSTISVQDVKLRLRLVCDGVAEPELKFRNLVVTFPQRTSGGAEWTEPHYCYGGPLVQAQAEIPGKSTAVIVGVIEELLFKKSSVVTISGAILYRQKEYSEAGIQDPLNPEVLFKVEDLIRGDLSPFSQQKTPDESDLVSVMVSSSCWRLSVSPRHRISAPLQDTLAQAELQQIKALGCWVGPYPSGGSLAGLLVTESGTTEIGCYSVELYARDMKQALHFVHSLHSHWKIEVCKGSSAGVQDCIQSLRAELCFLRSIAMPGSEYTSDEWSVIRDKLHRLELATDLNFTSYAPS